jgi:hypothetical protein
LPRGLLARHSGPYSAAGHYEWPYVGGTPPAIVRCVRARFIASARCAVIWSAEKLSASIARIAVACAKGRLLAAIIWAIRWTVLSVRAAFITRSLRAWPWGRWGVAGIVARMATIPRHPTASTPQPPTPRGRASAPQVEINGTLGSSADCGDLSGELLLVMGACAPAALETGGRISPSSLPGLAPPLRYP